VLPVRGPRESTMSSQSRVLIFGGEGQVGRAIAAAGAEGECVALSHSHADVTDPASVAAALDAYLPEVVINAAVFQPVDLCESAASAAFAVNALGPGYLAAACGRRDVRLIHLSTDYVFSGAKRTPFRERDCPAPLNVYARSKLAGEHVVLAADARHSIVRTSSVYGRSLPGAAVQSFVARMLQRALDGEPTRVVDDQIVSPTCADDLAQGLWQLAGSSASGLFHMAGSTPASWYEVAETVFRYAGRPDLLARTTSAEFGAPATRAPYTALTSERLEEAGIEPIPGHDKALSRHLDHTYPDLRRG